MGKLNFKILLGMNADGVKSGVNQAKGALNGLTSSLKNMVSLMAGAFAVGQIKAFARECVSAYSAQIQAETKLATIMKQRMNASDAEVKSVLALTAAQQKLGVVGDEVQLAGAQQVATFLKNKAALDTLIPAMNNLIAQQKGINATQGDAVTIGNMMGKVMQGQTSALKRCGISFTEAQEQALKFGTEEQRAAVLAQVITDNVGDMNAQLAQTDAGKIQQMQNALGDMREQIGGAIAPIVSELAPRITEFATTGANAITSFIDVVKNNFTTFAELIVGVFAAIKLTPLIQSWLANFSAAQDAAAAKAAATAAKRQAVEEALNKKKQSLTLLEAQYEEASGSKKVSIAQKIATTKNAIKKQETQLLKAQEAEQVAAAEASAIEQRTILGAAFASIKTAGVVCWTTIKGVMISTGIGALIMAIVFAAQKLWEKFGEGSGVMSTLKSWAKSAFGTIINWVQSTCNYFVDLYNNSMIVRAGVQSITTGFKNLWATAKLIIKLVMEQFKLLADELGGLGEVIEGVFTLDWKKFTGGATKMFTAVGKMIKNSAKDVKDFGKEAAQNYVDGFKNTFNKGGLKHVNLTGGGKGKGKATTTTAGGGGGVVVEDSPTTTGGSGKSSTIKEAKEELSDYQKLIEDYQKKQAELNAALKVGNVTQEEYNKQLQDTKNSLQQSLETVKAKNAEEQQNINALKEQLALTREIATEDEKAKQKAELDKKLGAAVSSRDTTFDYKLDSDEKIQAELELKLETAKKQLDILKDTANKNIDGIDEEINKQMASVTSLEDALKLQKMKSDMASLKKDLNTAIAEGANQGWSAVKNVVSDVQSCVQTIQDPDASGWEKFTSVIDTLIGVLQSVQGIMETINTIQKISTALTTADTTAKQLNTAQTASNAATSVSASSTKAAAATTAAGAEAGEAIAGATAAGASIPFPYNIAAIAAGVAAVIAALATTISAFSQGGIVGKGGVRRYAGGGIVTGATSHGDFIPAMLNANEMVLNPNEQNRLFRLATGQNSNNNISSGNVRFEIEGRKLVGILSKEENHRLRS